MEELNCHHPNPPKVGQLDTEWCVVIGITLSYLWSAPPPKADSDSTQASRANFHLKENGAQKGMLQSEWHSFNNKSVAQGRKDGGML